MKTKDLLNQFKQLEPKIELKNVNFFQEEMENKSEKGLLSLI